MTDSTPTPTVLDAVGAAAEAEDWAANASDAAARVATAPTGPAAAKFASATVTAAGEAQDAADRVAGNPDPANDAALVKRGQDAADAAQRHADRAIAARDAHPGPWAPRKGDVGSHPDAAKAAKYGRRIAKLLRRTAQAANARDRAYRANGGAPALGALHRLAAALAAGDEDAALEISGRAQRASDRAAAAAEDARAFATLAANVGARACNVAFGRGEFAQIRALQRGAADAADEADRVAHAARVTDAAAGGVWQAFAPDARG